MISRQQAIARKRKRYSTGKPCPHGHVCERFVSNYACVECMNIKMKKFHAAYSRMWFQKNKKKARASRKAWYLRNIDKVRKFAKIRRKNNPASYMLSATKHRAKSLNIKFNLTIDDIVIPKFCPVLGIKLRMGKGNTVNSSPTVDRINSKKGYTKGNVAVISHLANSLKGFATAAQHRRIAAWMETFK